MGVELPLHVVVTILECCVTFSGVKLSIRSFVLLLLEEPCHPHLCRLKQKIIRNDFVFKGFLMKNFTAFKLCLSEFSLVQTFSEIRLVDQLFPETGELS